LKGEGRREVKRKLNNRRKLGIRRKCIREGLSERRKSRR